MHKITKIRALYGQFSTNAQIRAHPYLYGRLGILGTLHQAWIGRFHILTFHKLRWRAEGNYKILQLWFYVPAGLSENSQIRFANPPPGKWKPFYWWSASWCSLTPCSISSTIENEADNGDDNDDDRLPWSRRKCRCRVTPRLKSRSHTIEAKPCHGSEDFASAHVPFQSWRIKDTPWTLSLVKNHHERQW